MKRLLWLVLPLLLVTNTFGQAPIPTSKYVKAKMFINVRDYGASGDSAQDALPYLEAARDALAARLSTGENGILYFPYGTYRLADSAFSITTSGIHMVGDGARIITTDSLYSGHLIGIVGDSDNIIRDVSIRGFEIHDYYRDTCKNNGIGVVWADGPVVSDNVIRFATRKGISTHYVRNAWIERNKIDTACFSGISIEWGTEDSGGLYQNVWVKDNIIELVDTSLVQNNASGDQYVWVGKGNGIVVTSHDTSSAIMQGRTLENVFILNNVIGTVPKKPIAWVNYTSQRKPTGLELGNIVMDSLRYGKFGGALDVGKSGQIRLYQTDTTQSAAATRGFVTTRDGDYTKADLLGLHLFSSGTSDLNVIEVGGGYSSYQAADYGRLFSADGHGDTEGAQRLRWDSTQVRIYGVPLRLDTNLYMDYNADQQQQYIYFSDDGSIGQAWLRFDTTSDLFTVSNGLVVNASALYVGGSADQQYNYVYFPDNSASGQVWIRYDTTNNAFMLTNGTNLYKGGVGNALVADSQYVTKDYADNASAGLSDGAVTYAKLATETIDSLLHNTAFQDSLEAALINADTLDGRPVDLNIPTGLKDRFVLYYRNSTGQISADSLRLQDIEPTGAAGQIVYNVGGTSFGTVTLAVEDSSSLLGGMMIVEGDTIKIGVGADTTKMYFNASSEFIIDGPGSGPSFADSAGAVDTANTTFTTYVSNHVGSGGNSEVSIDTFTTRDSFYIAAIDGDTGLVVYFDTTDANDSTVIRAPHGVLYINGTVSDVAAQVIVGDDVDSTAENFVFSGAYHVTSATADSAYVTAKTIADSIEAVTGDVTVSGGASAITAQSIVGDDIDSTAENFVFSAAYKITSAVADSVLITREELEDSITAWRANFDDSLSAERVFDLISPFLASNVENGITVTPQDADNTIDFTVLIDSSHVTDQSLTPEDLDTTSENFVFDGAFHVTSAEADSAYVTANTINDSGDIFRAEMIDSGAVAAGDTAAALRAEMKQMSFTFDAPAANDTILLPGLMSAYTIDSVIVVVEGGTSIEWMLEEAGSNGGAAVDVLSAEETSPSSGRTALDDGTTPSISNAGIDAEDCLRAVISAVNGTVGRATISIRYHH